MWCKQFQNKLQLLTGMYLWGFPGVLETPSEILTCGIAQGHQTILDTKWERQGSIATKIYIDSLKNYRLCIEKLFKD